MKHYIIPIFIPHYGCTHACVFCNQQKITGRQLPVTTQEIAAIIDEHIARITQERYIEVAFYGGSFTALDIALQSELLASAYQALQDGKIHGIRLSTRPDCITDSILDNLIAFGVSIIELGVQSLDNAVLHASLRGHTSADVVQAVTSIRNKGLQCGIQLMPGLPGEEWESLIASATGVVNLTPDFVRIYPTIVIAHTQLARMYAAGTYTPLSLPAAIARTAYLKLLFTRYHIPVIRTGLQATEDLGKSDVVLAGPYHPAFGEMVDSYLFYVMLSHSIDSLRVKTDCHLSIHHHPRDTSKVRGMANGNLKKIKDIYPITSLTLTADGEQLDELIVEYEGIDYVINKSMITCI